ncbi:hypothetical protein DLH72_00225 [Candidatus Gracilibacteria bacterium]|nr:MAG: hypothetical protein DLH72_00225 [Candidatus Gracilibacteria bacterium]
MENKKNNKFLTNIFIYLTIFSLGIFYSYFFLQKPKILVSKSDLSITNLPENNQKPDSINLDKFHTVYNYLEKNFYDFDEIKKEDLVESSIVGLVKGFNDPYTEYLNPKENKDFSESLSGDFEGIGAVLEKDDLGVKIISVIENSPAKGADLRVGDIITDVNGKNIANLTTTETIALIKGPAGKEVNLIINRDGEKINKQLFTKAIVIPSISGKDIDEQISYIGVSTFGAKTANEFEKELEKFKNKKGIIIDLRGNGGGYLDIAIDILGNFIKKGEILAVTKYKSGKEDKYFSKSIGNNYEGKVVILVDNYSASASEIVAGAMKDYGKAILVGEKTYGKGSVQNPIGLADGSMIKITTAKWFTPKDINIDKEGILPDVEVKITEQDIKDQYDRQLEEAKKVLKSFIENNYLQLSIDKYKEKS